MHVYHRTQRLLLRRLTLGDAELLIDLDSDPEVMRYLGGRPVDAEHIRQNVLPDVLDRYERGEPWGMWAALLLPALDFVGWFHLWPNPEFPEYDAEVGYRLKPAYWGRGLATEGTIALLDKAFGEFGCSSVSARTLVTNAASQRVLQKAGMQLVRQFAETKAHHATAVLYARMAASARS
jgi:RimJ/RimL family protein N-acetyltransferase